MGRLPIQKSLCCDTQQFFDTLCQKIETRLSYLSNFDLEQSNEIAFKQVVVGCLLDTLPNQSFTLQSEKEAKLNQSPNKFIDLFLHMKNDVRLLFELKYFNVMYFSELFEYKEYSRMKQHKLIIQACGHLKETLKKVNQLEWKQILQSKFRRCNSITETIEKLLLWDWENQVANYETVPTTTIDYRILLSAIGNRVICLIRGNVSEQGYYETYSYPANCNAVFEGKNWKFEEKK